MTALTKTKAKITVNYIDTMIGNSQPDYAISLQEVFDFTNTSSENWTQQDNKQLLTTLIEAGYDYFPLQPADKLENFRLPLWKIAQINQVNKQLELTDEEKSKIASIEETRKEHGLPTPQLVVGNYLHARTVRQWLAKTPDAQVTTATVLTVHNTLINYLLGSVCFTPLTTRQISLLSGCSPRQVRRAVAVLEDMGFWIKVEGAKPKNGERATYWRTSSIRLYFPTFSEVGYEALRKLAK